MDETLVEFFRSLVKDTMQHRTSHGIVRPDMIQLLMESKKGSLSFDEMEIVNSNADGFATVSESTENRNLGNEKQVWTDDDYTHHSVSCFSWPDLRPAHRYGVWPFMN